MPGDKHNSQPGNNTDDPEAKLYSTVPLEAEDGSTYVIQQQNVGPDNELGGGEWPDPTTPSRGPSPGPSKRSDPRTPGRS
jgi:hypothetical protein